jgi:hypothetical protein
MALRSAGSWRIKSMRGSDAAPYTGARATKQMPETKKAARRRPFAFEIRELD